MRQIIIFGTSLLLSLILAGCSGKCLSFEDKFIEMYMINHYDRDGDKCISKEEALLPTEIEDKAFYQNVDRIFDSEKYISFQITNEHKLDTSFSEYMRLFKHEFQTEIDLLPCPKTLSDLNQFPNLRRIGKGAFNSCLKLNKINLKFIEKVEDAAFTTCGLEEIDMPKLNNISYRSFYENAIKYVKLSTPDNIHIEKDCFGPTKEATLVLNKNKHTINGDKSPKALIKEWAGMEWKEIEYED